MNLSIKDSSSNINQAGNITNSIAVQGDGKVYAQPDVFLMDVSVSKLAESTATAQSQAKQIIDQIMTIAKELGIEQKDIQTTNLSINPEYDYNQNTQTIKGYRATHSLTLKIRKLDTIDALIPKISFDNDIQIQSMRYYIDDKTTFYSQARKLAYTKAEQKAQELAGLAGVTIDKAISINDQIMYNPVYPMQRMQMNTLSVSADAGGQGNQIAPGQLEVSVQVNVVYGMK
jgi:uncharacterized protein